MDDRFNDFKSETKWNKKHKVKYTCNECEYVATKAGNLKTHRENKHEGVRYPCSQCEYIATQVSALKRHFKSQHEGVRYPCSKCDHSATDASNLKKHVESMHEGVRYPRHIIPLHCLETLQSTDSNHSTSSADYSR